VNLVKPEQVQFQVFFQFSIIGTQIWS